MAVDEGMIRAHDRTMLVQYGGYLEITKVLSHVIAKRMDFVKHKATTKSTPGMSAEVFQSVKDGFLKQITRLVILVDMPDKLIINLGQTGVKLFPIGDWTMAAEGIRRVEAIGLNDKRQITARWFFSANTNSLPGKNLAFTLQVQISRWL